MPIPLRPSRGDPCRAVQPRVSIDERVAPRDPPAGGPQRVPLVPASTCGPAPVRVLLVSQITVNPESREIVCTITALANNLGKVTIVEGIEAETELELVRRMRPDRIQGYLISTPLPASGAGNWIGEVLERGVPLPAPAEAAGGSR